MNSVWCVFKRELRGYFATPVAYVFIVIFLVLTGVTTFQFGKLYESNLADLQGFFGYHPFLYLFLIPAISMRLWAEERKTGTVELLMTLPVTVWQAVIAKFLAAWAFTGIALILTFPTWITVNYLGDPDNGIIIAGYIGSFLMAGAYIAIGAFISSMTKNQVIAFVLAFVVCGFLALLNFLTPVMLKIGMGEDMVQVIGYFNFMDRFRDISRGVFYVRDLVFYLSLMSCFLFANALMLDIKKAR